MDTLLSKVTDIGWWIDGLRGVVIPIVIFTLFPKFYKKVKNWPKWNKYKETKWILANRHNPIAVHNTISQAQTFQIMFYFSTLLALILLSVLPHNLPVILKVIVKFLSMLPMLFFELAWLSSSNKVSKLIASNDRFRHNNITSIDTQT